jgi:putative ABC transport system permease protein
MRQLLKTFKVALSAINKNRSRSLLTTLGVIIGVAAVIMTISAGEGAAKSVSDQISGMGTNLLMIRAKSERRAGLSVRMGKPLDKRDFDILKKNSVWMPKITPLVGVGAQVVGPNGYRSSTVYGVSEEYFDILSRELSIGDFFTAEDVQTANKVCIIGETLREELFSAEDPIGRQIQINKVPFTVLGLLKELGEGPMGQDQDDICIAPYTTIQNRLSGNSDYNMIMASASNENTVDDAKFETTILLREAHRLLPEQEDDFEITTQLEIQELSGNVMSILTILLGAIGSISLIVGGVGIMNIMLVSVTERTREIGTRLAIGARESDILIQFLIEAIVLSLAGGLLGVLLGVVGNQVVFKLTNFFIPTSVTSILIGFGFSAFVGIAFGYFPARKAARLNPIDALRFE